jgi:hypothetical protein
VPQHRPVSLDELFALTQGYAEFAMRNIDQVPPALLANSPTGWIHFVSPKTPEHSCVSVPSVLKRKNIGSLK